MILKNSIILAFFSVLSVLLGVVRDRLLATHVGVGPLLDLYNASFRLPDLLYAFSLAFVTSATVVPFLTVEDKKGEIEDPRKKLSSIFLFVGMGLTGVGTFIAITIPYYAHLIVPGFTGEQLEQFISLSRLLLVQPILLGLTSLVSCYAQLKNHFLLFGISPLFYSLGIIGGIIYLYPGSGVTGLIYGVIVGAFVSFLVQLFSLRHARMSEVGLHFSWSHIRELVRLGIPRTGLNVITQIRTIIFTGIATTLGPGVLSSYLFAQRIMDASVQVIQQSVTAASIPVLSRDVVEHKVEAYKTTVKRYVYSLGLIGVLISGTLFLLQDVVIYVLYGDTSNNAMIAYFLMAFLVVLPLHMMTGYLVISLYAMKDTKSVFISGLIASMCGIAIAYATMSQGLVSLVYGVIVTFVVSFLIILFVYFKKKTKDFI